MADRPLLEVVVAAPEIEELTIVVFAPAEGATPLPFASDGVLGEVALNNTYPVAVAPETGNVAAVQLKSILLEDVAEALKPEACEVGAPDNVRKFNSLPYTVPNSFVT
jgi:hypothetical protein